MKDIYWFMLGIVFSAIINPILEASIGIIEKVFEWEANKIQSKIDTVTLTRTKIQKEVESVMGEEQSHDMNTIGFEHPDSYDREDEYEDE